MMKMNMQSYCKYPILANRPTTIGLHKKIFKITNNNNQYGTDL